MAATLSLDDLMAGDKTADTRERFIERITAEQNVEGELLKSETCAAMRAAVAELAPAARRLIERHYDEAVPVSRLAEELGLSRQGIYARQRIALRQLRAAFSRAVTAGTL